MRILNITLSLAFISFGATFSSTPEAAPLQKCNQAGYWVYDGRCRTKRDICARKYDKHWKRIWNTCKKLGMGGIYQQNPRNCRVAHAACLGDRGEISFSEALQRVQQAQNNTTRPGTSPTRYKAIETRCPTYPNGQPVLGNEIFKYGAWRSIHTGKCYKLCTGGTKPNVFTGECVS